MGNAAKGQGPGHRPEARPARLTAGGATAASRSGSAGEGAEAGRASNEDFLARWSARKLKARSAPPPQPAAAAAAPAAGPATASGEMVPDRTDAEILDELGLPDPDDLEKGDDFAVFLRAGIPAQLRSRALRRLWLSDPVLANLDGLNDYEQDFTDKATVRPDLKTAYRVGKGLLREPPAPAADTPDVPPAEASAADKTALAEDAPAGPGSDYGPPATADGVQASGTTDEAPSVPAAERPSEPTARPRRMRFRFG